MKNAAMFWAGSTTLVLVTVTIMAVMNFPFNWVFYLTLIGQVMIVLMIYSGTYRQLQNRENFRRFLRGPSNWKRGTV
jgi:hypothetical protein